MNIYTSYEVNKKARKVERQRLERLHKARRFDAMCRQLGYTRAAAAKTLQVSERTLHNWVSGKTAVPYAAYKLLRVLCFHEIPFKTWHGWHFAGGKLWSPEGHGFTGLDGSWWSLLVRQARASVVLFDQQRELRATIASLNAELESLKGGSMVADAGPAGMRKRPTGASGAPLAGRVSGLSPCEEPVTPHIPANFGGSAVDLGGPVFSLDAFEPDLEPGVLAGLRLRRFLRSGVPT